MVCWKDWEFFLDLGFGADQDRQRRRDRDRAASKTGDPGKRGPETWPSSTRTPRTRSWAEEPEAIKQLIVHDFGRDRPSHSHERLNDPKSIISIPPVFVGLVTIIYI
jgi:hypothetical protein